MKGKLQDQQQYFGQYFHNLIPTATITRKINGDQSLSFSYTQRITRPYIYDLNPNINAADPKNLQTGNPDLLPERTHQVELVHGWNKSADFFVNSSIYLRSTTDAVVEFTSTDAAGISTTRKENLAGNKSYGLNISVASLPTNWWSLNSNININYLSYESDALRILSEGWAADIDLSTSIKFPLKFTLQLAGSWNSRKIDLQGISGKQYYYSTAIRKEWKNPSFALSLLLINPFDEYIPQTIEMTTPQFFALSRNRYYTREFRLTLNWEFGSRMQSKKAKTIKNDDVNKGPNG